MRTCLILLALGALAASEFPLPAMGYAATEDISHGWRFAWDAGDIGLDQGWERPEHDRGDWNAIDLPRVWDRAPGTVEVPIRSGVGWYARRITIPADWNGSALIHFLGVQYQCDLWVDGRYVDLHLGGYTPFAIDLAGLVEPGGEHLLVLRVDNRLSRETVPSAHLGWQPYGGITREVFLVHRPPVYLDDLRWRCRLDGDAAELVVTGTVVAAAAAVGPVQCELLAGDERVAVVDQAVELAAGGRAELALQLRVPAPRLWSPTDPYLHRLRLRWPGGELSIPLGLREVRIDGDRVLLNGRPLWLQGFGIHEEWPGHGPCVPPAERRAELELLVREYGINSIRPGHYPNHPELYRLCDELGVLVFTEIPAWQIPKPWLASDHAWEDWLRPQLDAMVEAYAAFTSVVAWSAGNENNGDAADAYHQRALDHLRTIGGDRIPMVVVASTSELRLYRRQAMGARNYHFGWYHSKLVYAIRQRHAQNLMAAAGAPIWVAEQGAHAIRARYNGAYNDRSRGSEFYQDQAVRFGFQYAATRNDAVVGISPWSWADFYRNNRLEPHGLVDIERRPKLLASTLRNLMGGGPHRVFGCEETTFCAAGDTFVAELHSFRPDPELITGTFAIRWSIRNGSGELASGERSFAVDGARSQLVERVEWPIPADADGHHGLWFSLVDEHGAVVHTGAIHFGVGSSQPPGALVVAPGPDRHALWWDDLRLEIHDFPGLIIPLAAGAYRFELEGPEGRRPLPVTIRSGEATTVD